jgi:hypothetical protein
MLTVKPTSSCVFEATFCKRSSHISDLHAFYNLHFGQLESRNNILLFISFLLFHNVMYDKWMCSIQQIAS